MKGLKIGDRVYCTDNGEEGVIKDIDNGKYPYYEVDFDNGEITWVEQELIEKL